MKAAILSIILFCTVNLPDGKAGAQTIWYVDRDATGANTGRSWEDAWNTLDSSVWLGYQGINWAIIGDGDTIYVSGGTDSTTYKPVSHNSYNGIRRETSEGEVVPTFNETVIVTRAWHPNHNGEVYFTTKNDDTYNLFTIAGVNNVKIAGFHLYDTRSDNSTADNGLIYVYNDNNTFENCIVYNAGLTGGFYLAGYKGTIRGCRYTHQGKDRFTSVDPIGISDGRGGHIIENNIFSISNVSVTTPQHIDFIQLSGFSTYNRDNNLTTELVIRNNLLTVLSEGIGWNAIFYTSGGYSNINFYIYNNIIVSNNTIDGMSPIFAYQAPDPPYEYTQSWYVFNNTILYKDDGLNTTIPVGIEGKIIDTLVFKNNIIISDSVTNPLFLRFESFYEQGKYYRRVDNNAYFELGGVAGNFYVGEGFGAYSYAQWRDSSLFTGDLYDANSITGNSIDVTFDNKYGENITDYYTTTGRDAGANIADEYPALLALYPDIEYDILGNPRGATWDMGALEYQGSQSNNINVKGKIFLQGPFSTNSMLTTLNQSSLLPNSQPYNEPPWNYNGNESFASGPNATMVDWVLVELRSASNPAQVIARRAAVLKNNGLLLNTNGVEGINFSNVDPGSYYIAIYHRNHLAIMSSTPIPLSSNSALYDFTTVMNKAYGQNPMVELAPGKYGMYATDGNADGVVNSADRDEVWFIQNGNMGYLGGDFNMNSGVTVHDVNQFWNINNGAMTQVP